MNWFSINVVKHADAARFAGVRVYERHGRFRADPLGSRPNDTNDAVDMCPSHKTRALRRLDGYLGITPPTRRRSAWTGSHGTSTSTPGKPGSWGWSTSSYIAGSARGLIRLTKKRLDAGRSVVASGNGPPEREGKARDEGQGGSGDRRAVPGHRSLSGLSQGTYTARAPGWDDQGSSGRTKRPSQVQGSGPARGQWALMKTAWSPARLGRQIRPQPLLGARNRPNGGDVAGATIVRKA